MVRNGPHSLRGSVSTLSLRNRVEEDKERATRERIAELEAQLAAAEAKVEEKDKELSNLSTGALSYTKAGGTASGVRSVPEFAEADKSLDARQEEHLTDTLSPPLPPPECRPVLASGAVPGPLLPPDVQETMRRYRRRAEERLQRIRRMSTVPGPPSLEDTFKLDPDFKSLFEKFNESRAWMDRQRSLISNGLRLEGSTLKSPEAYCEPFCDFLTENPTVFHAVDYFEQKLSKAGFKKVC